MIRYYIVAGFYLASLVGVAWGAYSINEGKHASIELAAERAAHIVSGEAAEAIKAITPKYVTINRAVEHELRVETRYRDAACEHTPAVWLQLQRAYEAAGGSWPSGDSVPATSTAVGSEPR